MPLQGLEARWGLSNAGYAGRNQAILTDLAFRLAALIMPGFAPPRTQSPGETTYSDEGEGWMSSATTYRLGDALRGLVVTETTSTLSDGVTPSQAGVRIEIYGLPAGCALHLAGTFMVPVYGVPNPASLTAWLPADAVAPITALLRQEFQAVITE